MGAYLSSPVTTKETFEGEGSSLRYGGSAMQGWRRTMEDAHLACTAVADNPDIAMFGVFDGHGGAEVAKFCQKYIVDEIQKLDAFEEGAVEGSLVRVFHRIDEMLRDPKHAEELEQFKTKEATDDDDVGEDNEGVSTMDALDLLKRVFQLKRPANARAAVPDSNGSRASSSSSGPAGGGTTNAAGGDSSSGGTTLALSPGSTATSASNSMIDPMPVSGDANVTPAIVSEEAMVQAGCTAVVALKIGNELYVANAGDSRGVLSRAGKAVALSEDHKPAHETERSRIISAGGFLSEIGGVCRVNGNLNLSRAIGDLKYKQNAELPPQDQIITAEPDIRRVTLQSEDTFFLLACDGVWDVMSNQDAVDFVGARLAQGMTPAQAGSATLDACLANDPKEARGVGCDNMTIVIVLLQPQAVGTNTGGNGPVEGQAASAAAPVSSFTPA